MKERKNFWCQPMCSSFFSEEEKSKLCRFVFLPSSWVFIFDFGPRIQFGHLSSSASHKRSLQHFKRRKLRHKKSERVRCSSSFLFAKVGVLDAWTITTRAFTRTRGKGDETLEFCCYTFCARARSLSVRKFKPVTVLFFFQTITF